jgi:hypothetical protein
MTEQYAELSPAEMDAELEELEQEAVEELRAVALKHVNRLPERSHWRRPFLKVAMSLSGATETTPKIEGGAR